MMKKFDHLKESTIACTLLLASSPALGKEGGFPPLPNPNEANPSSDAATEEAASRVEEKLKDFPGKTGGNLNQSFRIKSIKLDEKHKRKMRKCSVPRSVKWKKPRPRRTLSLAFDEKKKQIVTLRLEMSNISASKDKDERVLALLYSRCLSTKPPIKTRLSRNKLMLAKDIEIMGHYKLPSESNKKSSLTLEVDLETDKLAKQVGAGNETFYFQGALLKKSDYDKENYAGMVLSPLAAIHTTGGNSCPKKKEFSNAIASGNQACEQLPTKTE
jgi:hypothetical protein